MPQIAVLDASLAGVPILVGGLIQAEVLQGFRKAMEFNLAKTTLERLAYRDMPGRDIAVQSAGNDRLLRRQGITVRKTIAVVIATFCVSNGIVLLHADRDLDPVEAIFGLPVVSN